MSKIPRRYGPAKPAGKQGSRSKDMFGRNNELRFSLRLAEVIRIDYENMNCDLKYLQGSTPPTEEVPISAAYWSKRGFLGAMPSKGSVAIVGFTAAHKASSVEPLILAFLPNGFKTALRFDPFGAVPRDAEELNVSQEFAETQLQGIYGVDRRKMRKIYPGNILAMSDQGSEILLNEGVTLFDRSGSEFLLKPSDSSAILTAKDIYQTSEAGRKRFGRVVRNALNVPTDFFGGEDALDEEHPLFDLLIDAGIIFGDGTLVPDINSLPSLTLPDGQKLSIISKNSEDLDRVETEMFTECRVEVQEFSDGKMPFNDNHGFDADIVSPDEHFTPFIEKVSGTVIGNDPYTSRGRVQYGQLLRPKVFNSSEDTEGRPEMETLDNVPENGNKNLAAASLYRMRRPDNLGELFLSHDKEGHVVLSIPASTSKNPLGAGRSIEADLKGSSKVVMGKDSGGVSFDLDTKGGLEWTLGTITSSRRSMDLRTQGGISVDVLSPDINGDAVKLITDGDVAIAAEGSYAISTTEDHIEEIAGKKEVTADSLAISVGTQDYNTTILSDQVTTMKGSRETLIGEGDETTILTGGERTDIKQGNSELQFLAPSTRSIDFDVGGTHEITSNTTLNIERSGNLSANYSFNSLAGSYEVSITTGSIRMSTGPSSVNISPAGVSISGPAVSIEGSVALGTSSATNSVVGGVPGPNPHIDYMTGAPIQGNPLVRTV